MKKIAWMLVAICGLCLLGGANGQPALHFPLHGFSIAPLEGQAAGATSLLLTMSLPASGGFAPNVNVLTQHAPGSIDDYIAAGQRGIEQSGFKIVKVNKLDDHTVTFEYTGNMQGRPLHWYSKASQKGAEVLLATATTTEQGWAADSAQLRACVDSLQRDAGR